MKILLWFGFLAYVGICNAESFNVTNLLNKMLEGYDKRIRPNWGGPPVEIGITMYFLRIFDISTKDQTVKTDSYFRQSWIDSRLAFDAPAGMNFVVLGSEGASSFWQPDTFISDGSATFSHDGNLFFRVNRDGSTLQSVRLLTKTSFPMDLTYFPMDKQTFQLAIESYGSTARDITYKWQKPDGNSVGMSQSAGTPEFEIIGTKLKVENIALSSGNYSRLAVLVTVARRSGYYIRHFYFPTLVSFVLLYASFWFPVTCKFSRIFLILMSFATHNYLLSECWNHLPAVAYSTMLEEYIIFGLIMAVIAVLEYGLVFYLHSRFPEASQVKSDDGLNQVEGANKPANAEPGQKTDNHLLRSARYVMSLHQHRRSYKKVDIFCRVVYPLIFVIYNIWYWVAFP